MELVTLPAASLRTTSVRQLRQGVFKSQEERVNSTSLPQGRGGQKLSAGQLPVLRVLIFTDHLH